MQIDCGIDSISYLLINCNCFSFYVLQDVVHTICSPHGEVLRIMVMKRNTVTALVEFDNSDSARKAKQALNGCDVYSGCCTLKIDFASVSLAVFVCSYSFFSSQLFF